MSGVLSVLPLCTLTRPVTGDGSSRRTDGGISGVVPLLRQNLKGFVGCTVYTIVFIGGSRGVPSLVDKFKDWVC